MKQRFGSWKDKLDGAIYDKINSKQKDNHRNQMVI